MGEAFIGREAEITALGDRIAQSRLVTLLGIGGVGKSRLAREVALRSRARVVACDLAGARTEEDVLGCIAASLGMGLAVSAPSAARIDAVGAALAELAEGAWLLLDNVGVVARDVAALVDRWLDAPMPVKTIVTSRVRLGAKHESVVPVEPLPVEGADSDAARLFVERARAAGASLSDADASVVREIVGVLEGIPLAIELAAARARVLPPRAMLARLAKGQDAATMRHVVAETVALLDENSQQALSLCATFRGGFSLELADCVLGPSALDVLQGLVDVSLVRSNATAAGAARFDVLETVRAFALAELESRPELASESFRRHARAVVQVARKLRDDRTLDGPARLLALCLEHDNLAVALERLLGSKSPDDEGVDLALDIAALLEPVRMVRGHLSTYVEWLRGVQRMAHAANRPAPYGVKLCEARALLELSAFEESRAAFDEVLMAAIDAKDSASEGHARLGLARIDAHAGAWERAQSGFANAKMCGIRAKDELLLRVALASASYWGSELSDSEQQLVPLEQAASALRAAGAERDSLFWAQQYGRGLTDFDHGARARVVLEDVLARARAIADRRSEALASFALGGVFASDDDLEQAERSYREAVQTLGEVGRARERGIALGYLGVVLHMQRRFEDAEDSYEAACVALESVGDEPNAVLFSLFRAGLDADRDHTTSSAARLEKERPRAQQWAGSGMRPLVADLMSALLDAGLARAAQRREDLAGFAVHRASADERRRLVEARPPTIVSARDDYDWRNVSLEARLAARLASRAIDALEVPATTFVVARDTSRFRVGAAAEVDLATRPVLRRVLAKLVDERLSAPGAPVPAEALIEAGWPNETIAEKAALNRLHVTLGTLRKLGLQSVIEHVPGGWRVRTDLPTMKLER